MEKVDAKLDLAKYIVRIDNMIGKYEGGLISDQMMGDYFWNPNENQCHDKYSQLFRGMASITKRHNSSNGFNDAILLAKDPNENQQLGFILTQPITQCNTNCMATNVDNIIVCFGIDIVENARFQPDIHQTDYMKMQNFVSNNQILSNLNNYKSFEDVRKSACEQERMILKNALDDLAFNNNDYTIKTLFGKGYSVQVTGSSFHVTKCQKVTVDVTDYHNCTKNIPALYNGKFKFINPITFILSDIAEIIPCDPIFPIKWLIEGLNYCPSPKIRQCGQPSLLHLKRDIKGLQLDFSALKGRTFKKSQIEAHKNFERSINIREPLISKVANTASRNINDDGSVGNFLGVDSFNAINFVLNPITNLVGTIWNYISNFVPICLCILFAIRFTSDGFKLKKQYGCGLPCLVGLLMGPIHTLPQYVDQTVKWGLRRTGLFTTQNRILDSRFGHVI